MESDGMKQAVIIVLLSFLFAGFLPGCASHPADRSEPERDAVLHSTVGGLRQAEMRAETETGFWASLGEAGRGLVEFPVNLIVDIACLPADIWRTGKRDMEETRHQRELSHESDRWYETARGSGKEE
jgi:hypothetical protein